MKAKIEELDKLIASFERLIVKYPCYVEILAQLRKERADLACLIGKRKQR